MLSLRLVRRSSVLARALVAASATLLFFAGRVEAQVPSNAANLQFNAAAALHNREAFDLAADEWLKFIKDFAGDKRVVNAYYHLGQCRLQSKDHAGAVAAFEKVLAIDPKFESGMPQFNLGRAQFNAAQATDDPKLFAAAEKSLADALKNFPAGKHVAQSLYFQAESLYALDKKDAAVDVYRRFVEQFPQDELLPDVLYALGVTLDELNRSDDAQAVYVEFLTKFPQHTLRTDVDVRRAELLATAGDLAAAEKIFAAAANAPKYDAADYALLRQGGCLYDLKHFAQAAKVYDSLLASFPTSDYTTAAHLAGGKSEYFAGNYAAAAEKLAPLTAGNDEVAAEAAHWSGRASLKNKRPAAAEQTFTAALKRSPKSKFAVQLTLDLADALYEQPEKRADALVAYKFVYEKHPDDPLAPQARYLAAFTALELGRNDEAGELAKAFLKASSAEGAAGASLTADVLYIQAEALLRAGKHEPAAAAYDELLAAAPQHEDRPKWVVRRALALSLAGEHAAVIEALAKQADKLGEPTLKSEARYLLGLARQATKDYTAAAADFRESLQAMPDRPGSDETLLALAEATRLAGDAKAAQTVLAEFLEKYPKSRLRETADYRAAELAYADGNLKKAEAAYRRVVAGDAKSPLVPFARYGLSWTLTGQGDAEGAVAALDDLLEHDPPGELAVKGLYARAGAHQQLKHFDLAIADLKAFLKTKPKGKDLSDALFMLGLCQEGAGKDDDALATFEKLLEADPKYAGTAKVLYEIGWLHKNAGDAKAATAAFDRLSKEFKSGEFAAEAYFHVGENAYARKDYAAAVDAYFEARELSKSPELAEKASHKLGWSYFYQGKYAKAAEWFKYQQQAFAAGELTPDAAFMEGESLFKQDKFKEAIEAYARVKNPQGPDFAVLALMHAGQAAAQLEDWKTALRYLDAAVAEHPTSPYVPEINFERGRSRMQNGDDDEALALFEKTTAETDREVGARARLMIGEIYFNQKNHAEAVKHFFKVAYGYGYPEWQARAQFEAGRCFEALGKPDQAKRSYQEIVDKFPKSDDALRAKERLAALQK